MPPAHRDLPDEDLMLAYARGDAAAFDLLYARHEAGLYRFVRRLLGAPLAAQADEVFQEAWLRVVAHRAGFEPRAATWTTWAFTIAHNLAMDRLRVSGREMALEHEDGASVEDLAQRLSLPFETAKSRLRYTLGKLRGCMGAYLAPLEAAR